MLYCFHSPYTVDETIAHLRVKTHPKKFFDLESGVGLRIKGQTLVLQEQSNSQHPWRRRFVCTVQENEHGATVTGKFRRSVFGIVIFLFFLLAFAFAHINAIVHMANWDERMAVSGWFLLFYLLMIGMWLSGRVFYRKQEEHVLTLLKSLENK